MSVPPDQTGSKVEETSQARTAETLYDEAEHLALKAALADSKNPGSAEAKRLNAEADKLRARGDQIHEAINKRAAEGQVSAPSLIADARALVERRKQAQTGELTWVTPRQAYGPGSPFSFFRDLISVHEGNEGEARERLGSVKGTQQR